MDHKKRTLPLFFAAAIVAALIAATVLMLIMNFHQASLLREESEEGIHLTRLEATLEATHSYATDLRVDLLAGGQVEAARSTYALGTIGAGFHNALSTLSDIFGHDGQSDHPDLFSLEHSYDNYVESIAALAAMAGLPEEDIAAQIAVTEVREEEARAGLTDLRRREAVDMKGLLIDSQRKKTWLLWAVPTLLLLALAAGGSTLWIRSRRRSETVRLMHRTAREKDRFLATVSHELRTPLTAVLGFVDLLEEGGDTIAADEAGEMLHLAAREARDLAAIVEDLLVVARADGGEIVTARVPVNLNAQAAQVLEALELPEDVTITSRYEDSVRAIGDPARVRQIIRNLLTNALRYGGSNLVVDIRSGSEQAHLLVIDDGAGIPAEEWESIFEPYHRLEPGTNTSRAVGLGLAVSRQLARAMGGDLSYRHDERGSVFDLRMPTFGSQPAEAALSSLILPRS